MSTLFRSCAVVLCLLSVMVGVADSKDATATTPKEAVNGLIARLDAISRDREMTTAKKSLVAAEEIEKFNAQYRGQSLSVRLKIQDVVPHGQAYYVTATSPDLSLMQSTTGKFQVTLSKSEVLAITKDSVLAITGAVRAADQAPARTRNGIHEPGGNVAFPLRANANQWICLDGVTYRVEAVTTVAEDLKPGVPDPADLALPEPLGLPKKTAKRAPTKATLADKTKTDETRSVGEIRTFFQKGLVEHPRSYGARQTAPTSRMPSAGASARGYYNRSYTREELIRRFGNPSSTNTVLSEETWTFKCKDGTVRVRFKLLGQGSDSSSSLHPKTKLQVKSVDTLSPATSYRREDRP